jgi:hypothetical protein
MNQRAFCTLEWALAIALGTGAFFFVAAGSAAAKTEQSPCAFQNHIENLAAQRSRSANTTESIRRELELRKAILEQVIACSVEEVRAIRADIDDLVVGAADAAAMKKRIAAELEEAERRYEEERGKIPDLGVRGTRELAKALHDWRASNYIPLVERARSFVTWTHNAALLKTAQARLRDIQGTMNKLQLNENEVLQMHFQGASAAISDAGQAHESAKRALSEERSAREIVGQVRASLEALARAYQEFLEISKEVEKIIPS